MGLLHEDSKRVDAMGYLTAWNFRGRERRYGWQR
jgi:hypothetical protein